MSCIQQLLELKGDKSYIFAPNGKCTVIEGGGQYKGYEYLIIFTDLGFRCGYVELKNDDKYLKDRTPEQDKYDHALDVHGGVTFFDKPHLIKSDGQHKWIGFDACHCDDAYDFDVAEKIFPDKKEHYDAVKKVLFNPRDWESIKDFSYMENECKKLIDQLICYHP